MFDRVITGRPFRLILGVRQLDPAQWIQVDDDRRADLALKRRLLAERHRDVVAMLPAGVAASAELLDVLVAHLAEHHPALDAHPDPSCTPIDAAGRLVQEDLCVLVPEGGWRLVAASVCFPSRWRLADKLGCTVAEIHEPVPGYEAIAAATDAFFDRLAVDRPMWRTNWTILASPELYQDGTLEPAMPESVADLTMRVERQTLRRLPATGAAVFTIRTHRRTLAELVASRPALAGDLAATLRNVPPATIRYKGWGLLMDPLLEWLAAVAPAAGADRRPN